MNLSAKFGTWHDVIARIDGPAAARMGVELLGRWVDEGGTISDAQRYTLLHGAEAREHLVEALLAALSLDAWTVLRRRDKLSLDRAVAVWNLTLTALLTQAFGGGKV